MDKSLGTKVRRTKVCGRKLMMHHRCRRPRCCRTLGYMARAAFPKFLFFFTRQLQWPLLHTRKKEKKRATNSSTHKREREKESKKESFETYLVSLFSQLLCCWFSSDPSAIGWFSSSLQQLQHQQNNNSSKKKFKNSKLKEICCFQH